jgi:transcriptional regulator with XRE-family HTH domain
LGGNEGGAVRKRAGATDAHVGQRIRLRRTLLGISQSKLGEAVGLTFQQVQKYERGANQLSAGRLYQFANVLEVPVTYFFDGLQNKSQDSDAGQNDTQQPAETQDITRRETLELVRAYYAIDDDALRKQILHLAESIGESMTEAP